MNRVSAVFMAALIFAGSASLAQTQLVLLNGEKVMARFAEGQAISYKLKKSKGFVVGYIARINEFSFVTSYDTVPFSKIESVSLTGGNALKYRRTSFLNLIGSALLTAGVVYFAADEINSELVHGYGFDSDRAAWEPAVILAGSGIILRLIRKRSQRLRYPARLLQAPPGSPFWRPE
jgi:hypothetical protein